LHPKEAKEMKKLCFASDYQEGAHPAVMNRLLETNLEQSPGYGTDEYCESARERIRTACACPGAAVHFLAGGTQANAVVIGALLRSHQGVIAAESGHINGHEAGAVEHGGHKLLTLPHREGKLSADAIRDFCEGYRNDASREYIVMPGVVYISQPTELGTLYSLHELTAIHEVCREFGIPLYIDGARLAYALACNAGDVSLPALARCCDVFYIGGTKCGALFGEAVVIPDPGLLPYFTTVIKQHGALLAKGRILGVQFDALFTDGLYERVGAPAIDAADRLREALAGMGIPLRYESPANQLFPVLDNRAAALLEEKVLFHRWERADEAHTVIRLVTSWATAPADTEALIAVLREIKQ